MKNYFRAVLLIAILFVLGIGVFALSTLSGITASSLANETVVVLNDLTQDCAENWDDLSVVSETNYGVYYVVLDSTNGVRIDQRPDVKAGRMTVETAIKNRYPYQYVTRGDQILGAVIVIDDGRADVRSARMTILAALTVTGFVIIAGAVIYGLYVKKNIVTPFSRMETFAGKVAEGNLDEPLMMEKNNMFGVFSESFDIMREELSASRAREIALQKKEKELVASLSHDLKTPITGIKLTTELLKAKNEMGAHDADMEEKLDNIYKKADQIDVLVTDLFTSTLDDLGEVKVVLNDEPSSVLVDIVRKYDDKNLAVMDEVPGVIISTDVKRMSQVIGNIIHNSYKYADTKIDVGFNVVGNNLEMRIRDYGPGVPDSEIELITNKFYRGKAQSESGAEGSGLGLYIAKNLMEKMNGSLICESDSGLAITLVIPLA